MVYLNPDYLVYSFSHSCHLSLCRQLVHDVAGFLQSHSKGVFVNCIFMFSTREKSSQQLPGLGEPQRRTWICTTAIRKRQWPGAATVSPARGAHLCCSSGWSKHLLLSSEKTNMKSFSFLLLTHSGIIA